MFEERVAELEALAHQQGLDFHIPPNSYEIIASE